MTTLINRQPIYDRRQNVTGYEILADNDTTDDSSPAVTAKVLVQALTDIGLHSLVRDQIAFLHFSLDLVLERDPFPAHPQQVTIQLPAGVPLNTMAREGLQDLRGRGYTLALEFRPGTEVLPLLELADIVTIDVARTPPDQLRPLLEQLMLFHGKRLAMNVHNWETFAACHDLGFDYFEGFFFCHPEPLKGRKLPASRLTTLRLLARLNAEDTSLADLEKIIAEDVSLSYRLLRHLNSPFFGLPNKIDSIRHAVALLGLRNLRIWSSIILLAKLDDKPAELMKLALVRAKMTERLCPDNEGAFLTGLFSTLEALLDMTIDKVLADLPVADAIAQALTQGAGELGEALSCVVDYEAGHWPAVRASRFEGRTVRNAYLAALAWAEDAMSEMAEA